MERNYRGLIESSAIISKSDFVEKLTPPQCDDSFIVQVDRISDKNQTKLDKLLSIFEQKNFVDEKKITKEFRHAVDNADIKVATDILHHIGTDPEERRKIETEQEAWRTIDAMTENIREKLQKQLKLNKEKDKLIEELKRKSGE